MGWGYDEDRHYDLGYETWDDWFDDWCREDNLWQLESDGDAPKDWFKVGKIPRLEPKMEEQIFSIFTKNGYKWNEETIESQNQFYSNKQYLKPISEWDDYDYAFFSFSKGLTKDSIILKKCNDENCDGFFMLKFNIIKKRYYWGCSNYPKCKNLEAICTYTMTETICKSCNSSLLQIEKLAKDNIFISCSSEECGDIYI